MRHRQQRGQQTPYQGQCPRLGEGAEKQHDDGKRDQRTGKPGAQAQAHLFHDLILVHAREALFQADLELGHVLFLFVRIGRSLPIYREYPH